MRTIFGENTCLETSLDGLMYKNADNHAAAMFTTYGHCDSNTRITDPNAYLHETNAWHVEERNRPFLDWKCHKSDYHEKI